MSRPAAALPAPVAGILVRGLLVPLVAGALTVFAFAPFYWWPAALAGIAALMLTWSGSGSPRQAALSGLAFGLGFFLTGVSWVFVSLHTFGGMPLVLAAVATFLFCTYLALFPAAAGWLAARATRPASGARLAFAAASLVFFEWVRGWLFTGFPWLNLGTSQVPSSPLAGYAPYVGAYGVSLALAGCAALLAYSMRREARERARWLSVAAIGAILVAGAAAGRIEWTRADGEPVSIALLQGNVPQELKWREDVRARTLEDYRRMIFEAKARIVIIPETALPAFLDQLPPEYLRGLRQHAVQARKDILLGTVEREFRGGDFEYYNSLITINGEPPQSYRKRHLVPFGEFIPPGFRFVLAVLRIPLSDFSRGATGQPPLAAGGVRFGVAICYEDIFGEEVIEALPSAQVLVNVSNDAWFGESFAADQHLQASQMRALETGRWMVRSTNTGASAAIDERGRVASRLPPFTTGTLVAQVPPRAGATPYVRAGNLPALALVLAVAVIALARSRSTRPHA